MTTENNRSKTNLPCPDRENCGSSDAYSIQSNGWGHCFSCGKNFKEGADQEAVSKSSNTPNKFHPITEVFRAWPERGLTQKTTEFYKIHVGQENDEFAARCPRYDENGKHVGNKVRTQKGEKNRKDGPPFYFEGDKRRMQPLFGMNFFPSGSAKHITITEGYEDAMAAFQMSGSRWPCVSVDGAASAVQDCKNAFEYLDSFDSIVIAFDADEPGRKAAKEVADLFELGKVKILNFRKFKDANEYLINKEAEAFSREWWNASPHKPDGLKLGKDIWNEIIERKEHFTVPYPFADLNKLTYGLRLSELVVVTADTGVGKTSFLKSIEHKLLTDETVKEKGYGVGFLHLEEPNGDTALGLLSIHNGVPYHLPDSDRPEQDIRRAYDEVLNNDRSVIWDHFGSNSVDSVIGKIRHMAALGCRYIVIDHLSIIVSDQAGDERKQLDEIATKIKTLAMEKDLCIIAVIHTNRQGQIRGTAGVEQLANIVVRLERNKTDPNEWRRNVTKTTVEKNRFCGYTGPGSYLWYNKDTSRLSELENDEKDTYDAGGALNDGDIPF